MRLLRYSYDVSFRPGKTLSTADALSRMENLEPVTTSDDDDILEECLNAYAVQVVGELPVSDNLKSRILEAQKKKTPSLPQ